MTIGNPANSAHTRGRTIPENHADVGPCPTPEDHINVETVSALGGCTNEVILIPRNHVGKDTIHIRTDILTEVHTLPRIKGLTTQLWMP